ncbi:SH3 domain-containing protein [Flagellimonas hymeniacidonis]|uniref:SH3 domain-containing protein n=1 Tax=Flagellimonas hymeniacidonis TaxID=2603628 RepID=A0A5C8UZU0_9FLAO|nr:SH3 domain-containing protein [Flagellimonas hymeniacidonis]TXN34744.1 SH3 domain-containing protein [Flagellimonas hymeniacidonis]
MRKLAVQLYVILFSCTFYGQDIFHVDAPNGLIVRKSPDKESERLGKFDYDEKVEVLEHTRIRLTIWDNGEAIYGQWLKVVGIEANSESLSGYVFSGYLTKKGVIMFEDFTLVMEDIYFEAFEETHKDIAHVYLDFEFGGNPQNKRIKIITHNYKSIEIFQQYENSVFIMGEGNEGAYCDLTEWKHYYSEWIKIPYNKTGQSFTTLKYPWINEDKFIPIDMSELKAVVREKCGERWSNLISDIKDVNEYPSGVSISRIFLKINLTDKTGQITSKIIKFTLPSGC